MIRRIFIFHLFDRIHLHNPINKYSEGKLNYNDFNMLMIRENNNFNPSFYDFIFVCQVIFDIYHNFPVLLLESTLLLVLY